METSVSRDATTEELLSRLSDTGNYPGEHLAPYEEFRIGAYTFYFTPGGFLYRKDPGSDEVGASFVATSPTRSGTTGPTTDRVRASLARGRVDWYSANLGYGFIVPEDGGPKAFIRCKDITAGEEEKLENNDKVTYEMAEGKEGPEARNVSRV